MKYKNSNLSAFTMIELLVVVAIIGTLVTVSIISFSGVGASARDSTRLNDISRVAIALEKYYNINRSYPRCNGGDANPDSEWYTCLAPSLKSFVDPLPRDPAKKGLGYNYYSDAANTYLRFPMEKINPNINNASFSFYNGSYGFYMYTRAFGIY